MSIAFSRPDGYSFGAPQVDDEEPGVLTYGPPELEGIPAAAASRPWTPEERAQWRAAEMRDWLTERGSW
jgi:hypothetical protein